MPVSMGLQLFPPPPSKTSQGKYITRRGVIQHENPPDAAASSSRPPDIPVDGRNSPNIFGPEIPRSQTSFSDAPTLVRSNSNASHSSMAKPRIQNGGAGSSREPMIRSIFPRYNPDVPLEQQNYYPTQASPTHIPASIISRSPYANSSGVVGSPLSAPATITSFPRGVLDVPAAPTPSSTEELKQLWKVTNGWRVSASEGRSFCLKMTSAVEEPFHTLSSATHPFYTVRLDPTSTSAILTMTRQDPNKAPGKSSPLLGSSKAKEPAGLEVLTTTLEEAQRRLPPNDGLVALLYPRAAACMAIDLSSKLNSPGDASVIAAAELECGRLVWDADTSKYYLVHPALATPFCVAIAASPAWSRVEYTLEHPELPHNMVKLTRDGAGGGSLEVDTGVAARVGSFYIVDVAVCAVMIVALAEERTRNVERFEAPPVALPPVAAGGKSKKGARIEEMEIDVESQQSLTEKEKANLPKPTKGALKILYWAFKFVVWALTFMVKMMASLIICVSSCLTKKG